MGKQKDVKKKIRQPWSKTEILLKARIVKTIYWIFDSGPSRDFKTVTIF
jgi:hypothetical protein